MKKTGLLLTICMALLTVHMLAQAPVKATTEDGKQVLLLQDGTWKYAQPAPPDEKAGQSSYTKATAATQVLSINKGAASLSFDPNEWTISDQTDPNRTTFEHKSGDLYATVLAERIQTSLEALKSLAVQNAKNAATSFKILDDDTRVVNGVKVAHMRFQATIKEIAFILEGYYYAGPAGSIQVVTWSGANLYPEYKQVIQDFLDGFELAPAKPQAEKDVPHHTQEH